MLTPERAAAARLPPTAYNMTAECGALGDDVVNDHQYRQDHTWDWEGGSRTAGAEQPREVSDHYDDCHGAGRWYPDRSIVAALEFLGALVELGPYQVGDSDDAEK